MWTQSCPKHIKQHGPSFPVRQLGCRESKTLVLGGRPTTQCAATLWAALSLFSMIDLQNRFELGLSRIDRSGHKISTSGHHHVNGGPHSPKGVRCSNLASDVRSRLGRQSQEQQPAYQSFLVRGGVHHEVILRPDRSTGRHGHLMGFQASAAHLELPDTAAGAGASSTVRTPIRRHKTALLHRPLQTAAPILASSINTSAGFIHFTL